MTLTGRRLAIDKASTCVFVLLACSAWAQQPPAAEAPRPAAGYMVSEKLLDTVVKRWAFELANNVDLDEAEEQQVRDALRRRWVPFFQEHQQELAPLLERWMQAMVDPDPPTTQDVQSWARGALAMQDLMLEEFNRTEEELAELLPPDKVGRLKGELTQVRMGMGFMNSRLQKWERGEIDAGHWERMQSRRAERRERQRDRWNHELEAELTRLVTLSDWDQYVQQFVTRFGLDEAQKTSANNVLIDVKQRAQAYLDSHQEDLKKVNSEPSEAAGAQHGAALARRQELVEPLQKMFAELQSRLDNIPTEAQRAKVKEEQAAEEKPEQVHEVQVQEKG